MKRRGKIVKKWRHEDRHSGEERTLTVRESDLVLMNRWLRDMEVVAVLRDGDRRSTREDSRTAA